MFSSVLELEAFIREFEACRLPRSQWTHQAHLVAGFWYLSHHEPEAALSIVRERIKAHNVSVGTPNTDDSGYHETITRLYLNAIAAHIRRHSGESTAESLRLLLSSPLMNSTWPLQHYSQQRLFSVAARHHWVEPDIQPL